MRVITGSARGRRLKAPEGLDVRPTTDKVKEAIFSIVQFDIEGSAILDLFSGSGQMGIEALSRGASSCVFVDSSRTSVEVTKENISAAGFKNAATVMTSDSLSYLRMCRNTFDVAFLDPPYGKGIIGEALPLLSGRMSDRGIIVCEHEPGLELPEEFGKMRKYRTYKYGKIAVTVFKAGIDEE
ncbi:MAG: 16S rRNA (guanine(966)-N(2))-methyltransferase RsmD [Ruminococcus sp.]|nr:16S rRNA (guanine(966)-N(2))-methyltransferase RsmD [Ruminococcus sp.]MCM1380819.1 16S rRNA (guanine(966)-N(2))-methyltransferase RsmD [Muribaculaceae bacterium]MCM1479056.1 16S rRNA (guanine(966)-N(2))-methyltransferase RsmD [Muribaculaceae bacterium]